MFNMHQSWLHVILIHELKKNVFNLVFYFCAYTLVTLNDISLKYPLNNTYRWLFIYKCHHICLKQIQMGDMSVIFLPNRLGVNTSVSNLLSNVDIPLFVSCTVQKTQYSTKFSKILVNKYEKSCFYHMVQGLCNILHIRITITTLKDKLKKIKCFL